MTRTGISITACLLLNLVSSGACASQGIDEFINNSVQPITTVFSSIVFFSVPLLGVDVPLVVVWLIFAAAFFTVYFRFLNVRGFAHAIRLVRGDYADPDHPGEVSHFQALSTAVSGTVGIGNIGGVAVAISIGGPGATFWMIVAGVLGMSTKFIECTLGTMYRRENEDGSVSGGPMYYLEHGFAARGMKKFGKAIGTFYAVGIVIGCLGIGNMFQSNQAFQQFVSVTGGAEGSWFADKGWLFGTLLGILVGAVILGGIKSIARVTSKVVPRVALDAITGAHFHGSPVGGSDQCKDIEQNSVLVVLRIGPEPDVYKGRQGPFIIQELFVF